MKIEHIKLLQQKLREDPEFKKMLIESAQEDGTCGFCISCGAERLCVEPDAEEYECENCGGPFVYGAEQIILIGL